MDFRCPRELISHVTSTSQVQPTINCSSTSWTMPMRHFLRLARHAYMVRLRPTTWRTRPCGFNTVRHSSVRQRRIRACSESASGPHLGEGQTTRSKTRLTHSPLRTFYHRRHPEAHQVSQQGWNCHTPTNSSGNRYRGFRYAPAHDLGGSH